MRSSSLGYQLKLDNMQLDNHIVNVASVPQRSPFRYPGGKTWLVPRIRQWLMSLPQKPSVFIEPFAGGAIVGLNVAFDGLADRVVLVELDDQVAAVWKTVLSGESEWLVNRILSFHVTEESVRAELAQAVASVKEKAFQTLLKNRTFHGGILAPGSSVIKAGENGKGIGSRWYPQTLVQRIRNISKMRDRIAFIEGDGTTTIYEYALQQRAVFFVDPPYTAAGKKAGTRIYTHHTLNHERLFDIMGHVAGDFLMTYDDTVEVQTLATCHGFQARAIAMKNTHHARMMELLIGRDLSWLR